MTARTRTSGAWRIGGSVLGIAVGAVPHQVMACATCFGAADSKLAEGMTFGILALLAVVAMVLGGILSVGMVMATRARRVGEGEDSGQERVPHGGEPPLRGR